MKTFTVRHPYLFSLLVLLALFGLTLLSRVVLPSAVVGDVSVLSAGELSRPSGLDQVLKSIKTADNLFWALTILLAIALLSYLRRWRDAGFTSSRRGGWYTLILPLAACALALPAALAFHPQDYSSPNSS